MKPLAVKRSGSINKVIFRKAVSICYNIMVILTAIPPMRRLLLESKAGYWNFRV